MHGPVCVEQTLRGTAGPSPRRRGVRQASDGEARRRCERRVAAAERAAHTRRRERVVSLQQVARHLEHDGVPRLGRTLPHDRVHDGAVLEAARLALVAPERGPRGELGRLGGCGAAVDQAQRLLGLGRGLRLGLGLVGLELGSGLKVRAEVRGSGRAQQARHPHPHAHPKPSTFSASSSRPTCTVRPRAWLGFRGRGKG